MSSGDIHDNPILSGRWNLNNDSQQMSTEVDIESCVRTENEVELTENVGRMLSVEMAEEMKKTAISNEIFRLAKKKKEKREKYAKLIISTITTDKSEVITGKWTWGLILWVLFWDVAVFGTFMLYFLLFTCEGQSTTVAATLDSHIYENNYSSQFGGTYLCQSFIQISDVLIYGYIDEEQVHIDSVLHSYQSNCYLTGHTCDDYIMGSKEITPYMHHICATAVNNDVFNSQTGLSAWTCESTYNKTCYSLYIDYPGANINLSVNYIQCTPPTTAFTNSVQYTIYLQLVIYLLFMAFWIIQNRGFSSLFIPRTWFDLIFGKENKKQNDQQQGNSKNTVV